MNTFSDWVKEHPLPTRRDERWKYTDLTFLSQTDFPPAKKIAIDQLCPPAAMPAKADTQEETREEETLADAVYQHRLQRGDSILLVLVNGHFEWYLSDLGKLPQGSIVRGSLDPMRDDEIKVDEEKVNASTHPFAVLNQAQRSGGLYLSLPDHAIVELPIHILSLVIDDSPFAAHPKNIFLLGEGAQATILEEYNTYAEQAYLMNIMTTIQLNSQSSLNYYKIQKEGRQAVHMANTFVCQEKDSCFNAVTLSLGARFARDDLMVRLKASGTICKTAGFYHLRYDNQYIDHHLDINHQAPNSESEMLYKGILERKSKAVFNGRVLIEKNAQKIVANQANHNLLLSAEAEVYSKPELEIYADDVKCKHGASTGQLDQEALFYLRSRGIPYEDALAMLLQGFSEEVTSRIKHEGIQMRAQESLV